MGSEKSGDFEDKTESERMVPVDTRVTRQLEGTLKLIALYEGVRSSEIVRQFLREGVAKYRRVPEFKQFVKTHGHGGTTLD